MKTRYKFLIGLLLLAVILIFIFYVMGGYTSDAYVRANWTEISPRIEGYVKEVYVQDNQFVKEGDKLFQLDPYIYQLRLENLKAQYELSLSQYQTISDNIKMIDKQIIDSDVALKVAAVEVERYKALLDKNAVSIQEYQNYVTAFETAKNANDLLKRTLLQNQDQLVEQKNQIQLIKAQMDIAQFQYEITTVIAPFDGYVTNNYLMPGLFIQQGQPVFGIAATQKPWVEANFKEYWVGRIKPGQKVWISCDLYLNRIFEGKVVSVRQAVNRESSPGMILPYVQPIIDWVRLQYRFTVRIELTDLPADIDLRMGSDARVYIFFW